MASLNAVFRDPEAPTRVDILAFMALLSVKEQHSMGLISDEEYKDFLLETYDVIYENFRGLCGLPKEENSDSNPV